jgi:anti-sigma factor RsiW
MAPAEDDRLAELTALADGTLRGRRRKRLEAELERSPELAEALANQRRAIAALRSV